MRHKSNKYIKNEEEAREHVHKAIINILNVHVIIKAKKSENITAQKIFFAIYLR